MKKNDRYIELKQKTEDTTENVYNDKISRQEDDITVESVQEKGKTRERRVTPSEKK